MNRPSRARLTLSTLTALAGAVLISLAVLANSLGIDHDLVWGRTRILMAVVGSLLIFYGLLVFFWARLAPAWRQRVSAADRRIDRVGQNVFFRMLHSPNHTTAAGLGTVLFLLGWLGMLWFSSAGKLANWPVLTSYYNLQAEAYQHGQIALLIKPDPQLLALPNPYDYHQRGNKIPVLGDASLYNGHYYLYWGAAPALVAWGVRLFTHGPASDGLLLLIFSTGATLFSTLLVLQFRRKLFPTLPAWAVVPPLLAVGFFNPFFYMLSLPAVYQAAISSAQFFLLGGLYFAFQSFFSVKRRPLWLALTGLFWSGAFWSRLNLAPAVGLLAALTLWKVLRSPKPGRFLAAAALAAPLLVAAAGLGGYNYARFGSVLETGHR